MSASFIYGNYVSLVMVIGLSGVQYINQGVIGQVILNRARTCDVLKGLLIKCIHACAHEKDDSLF